MRDYIKEGFKNYDAPCRIYNNICEALKNPCLTFQERVELMRQKEEAKRMALKLKDLFPFEPED